MKKLFLFTLFVYSSLFSQINVGQRFILTLPADTSKSNLKNWLKKTKPAGIMLLYHSKGRQETKDLITFLQDEAKELGLPKLFITIDWEGGIVSRVNESSGFVSVPSPKNLALAGRTYSFLAGKLIGQQLRSVGVNMNFAPLLDVFNKTNPVLATRPFSENPKEIIELALGFSNGLKSEGVLPVFKHFPGLGLGVDDTHFEIVEINAKKRDFEEHVSPFIKILQQEYPVVMAAHASYPDFFGKLPVTLSKKAVEFIKNINKDTLLITDDFWMGGVRKGKKLLDVVLQSLQAGYHLLILSPRKGEDIELIDKLQKVVDNFSDKEKKDFQCSVNHISSFKAKKLNQIQTHYSLNEKKVAKLLAQKSIKELNHGLDLNNKDTVLISVDLPKLRPSESWFVDKNGTYLKQKLTKLKVKLKEFIFDAKDTSFVEKIRDCLRNDSFEDKNIIIQTFFYGRGVWNELQKKLLEDLKYIQNNVTVISLGHPYEKNILPKAKIFNLGSFSKPMLKEVSKRLAKNKVPNKDFSIKKLLTKLKNKKFGLLCHNASRVRIGSKEIFMPDLLLNFTKKQNNYTKLHALFSPEHGLQGMAGAGVNIGSQKISKWDCPVYSLHGKYKKPTKEMLKGLDLLIVDLHEVGVRAFTYLSSLDLVLQAAKENDLPVLVIDHVNPIYFWNAQGPELKDGFKSFVGKVDVQFIHGKTIGKIAKQINKNIGVKLTVLPTLPKKITKIFLRYNSFIAPSPNLVTLESVYSYPATVFIEGTNYSEGRGTNYPFQQIGAPWVDGVKLANILNLKKLDGVYFEPVTFKPIGMQGKSTNPKHKNKRCEGVFLHFYDLKNAKPIDTARVVLKTFFKEYPKDSKFIKFSDKYFLDHLVGNDSWRNELITS